MILVILPALGVSTEEPGVDGLEPVESAAVGPEFWAVAALIIVAAHVIDAVMTRSYGLKGHYPGKAPEAR